MAPPLKKRFEPDGALKALLDEIRDEVKEAAEQRYIDEDNVREGPQLTAYAQGVVDALAFVWAGMPEGAGELYRGTNSQFGELAREAGL